MKKLISLLIAVSLCIAYAQSVFASSVSYMADFESPSAKFGTSVKYPGTANNSGDYRDLIEPKWVDGEGKNETTGLQITYKAATYYAGEVFFPIPKIWENSVGCQYLNFDYKGKGVLKLSFSTQEINGYTVGQGIKYSYTLRADTKGEWQSISIPLENFKNGTESVDLNKIRIFTFMAGESGGLDNNAASTKEMSAEELTLKAKNGDVILDNMELSDVGENIPAPSETAKPQDEKTRVIDFDNYSLSHKQTWAGFKNDSQDYADNISSLITENGKDGKGFQINYTAATYYSGEIFTAIPTKWAIDEPAEYLEFDANGCGVLNINFETGEVINGTRYGQRVSIDTNGVWQKISLPISKFVNKNTNEAIVLSEVTGMTFTAAENGGLDNNAASTKEMSAEELNTKAKTGTVVIDNITLAEKSSVTQFNADFERNETRFGTAIKYSGHSASGYSDFVKGDIVPNEGAGETTGYKVEYSSAFYYAGEVFLPVPAIWENSASSEYLNFDYKGKGSVKISFSTGNKNGLNLTDGTRYGRRFDLDSHGEWAKISVPISEFVNDETSVNLSDIGAVTFQAAETAGIDSSSESASDMSAEELEMRAKKGSIIFDNMTLSDTEGETTYFTTINITAEQNGANIDKLSDGPVTIKADILDMEGTADITVVAAIYHANGCLDTVNLKTQKIDGDGSVMLNFMADDTENKFMKVFVFDDFEKLHPMTGSVKF